MYAATCRWYKRRSGQKFAGGFIFQMGPIFTRSRLSGAASDLASGFKTVAQFDLVHVSKGPWRRQQAHDLEKWKEKLSLACGSYRCHLCRHKLGLNPLPSHKTVESQPFLCLTLMSLQIIVRKKWNLRNIERLTRMDLTHTNSRLGLLLCDRRAHRTPACMKLYMHHTERAKLMLTPQALLLQVFAMLFHWRSHVSV